MFGATQGAYADKISVDYKYMLPLPKNMTFDQGAGEFFEGVGAVAW